MKKMRIHGRGGQGYRTAAELMAVAVLEDWKNGYTFPAFGWEMKGAPVIAFVRLDDKPTQPQGQKYEPDVITQDAKLVDMVDVEQGNKSKKIILMNTIKSPDYFKLANVKEKKIGARRKSNDFVGNPILKFKGSMGDICLI